MSETGTVLRATSDAVLADLETLEALERQKRELEPADKRTLDLSGQVEAIARRLLGRTVVQRELTSEAHTLAASGSPGAPGPINETPREIHLILADWRDAERRAAGASPDSPDSRVALADIDRFRDEYRRAHDAATRGR